MELTEAVEVALESGISIFFGHVALVESVHVITMSGVVVILLEMRILYSIARFSLGNLRCLRRELGLLTISICSAGLATVLGAGAGVGDSFDSVMVWKRARQSRQKSVH